MPEEKYLHGFSETEQTRLYKQAHFLEQTIYRDIDLSRIKHLLEVGCGVGAQSEILLRRFPSIRLTSIDHSDVQLAQANKILKGNPVANGRYELKQMDAAKMDFSTKDHFDGAFLCWILEHVPSPLNVLKEVNRVLNPVSLVYITEVLNSSFFVEPYSPNVLRYLMRYNDLQYDFGGDPHIGAKLGNMLLSSGYTDIQTQIKTDHLDNRNPSKRLEMIRFWMDLLLSAAPNLLQKDYVTEDLIKKMTKEMKAVANDPNAVFMYSFVQAKAYTSGKSE